MNLLSDLIARLRGIDPIMPENARAFESLLADVCSLQTPDAIIPMLGLFNDQARFGEVMFSIIHCMELFPDEIYVEQILRGAVDFCRQSPRWASIVFMRILNSESTRSELGRQLRSSPACVKASVKTLMDKINERSEQFVSKTMGIIKAAS